MVEYGREQFSKPKMSYLINQLLGKVAGVIVENAKCLKMSVRSESGLFLSGVNPSMSRENFAKFKVQVRAQNLQLYSNPKIKNFLHQ